MKSKQIVNQFFYHNFIINHYSELVSTNDSALELIKNNQAQQNQIILSDIQTGGKGRLGRSWDSPLGNLYFSLVLKAHKNLENSNLSFLAAVALGEALSLKEINYKWPNDILFSAKKIAGILLEKDNDFIVIGIGVNLVSNPDKTNYPASNLKDSGVILDKMDLLQKFLDNFAILQQKWLDFGFLPIRNLWLEKAFNFKKEISVNLKNETLKGVFKNLDQSGNLVLNINNQDLLIASGEIFYNHQ